MKNVKCTFKIIVMVFFLVIAACKKDDAPQPVNPDPIGQPDPDPDPDPDPVNQAPSTFELLEVEDMDTDVSLVPTFKWNTSTDPDGDMVGYDILIGQETDGQDTLATELNTATYKLETPLERFTEYYWSVIAKDGKGEETSSDTFSFTTRNVNNPETPANASANFPPRMLHTVTRYKDKLWLFGGQDANGILND